MIVNVYSVVLGLFGILGNNVDILDTKDNNVDTSHGSSGAARAKKRKISLWPGHRTLAALAQEATIAPALGFSNSWQTDSGWRQRKRLPTHGRLGWRSE
jgi:hypothetical protein